MQVGKIEYDWRQNIDWTKCNENIEFSTRNERGTPSCSVRPLAPIRETAFSKFHHNIHSNKVCNWDVTNYVVMWLRLTNICMESITLTVHCFCHCLLEILVSVRVVIVWNCRKGTINRYFEQMFLVTGLWICGTLCLKTSYLIQLSTVWMDDLTVTVRIYDTVITVKTSNFKDQSTGLLAYPWLHHMMTMMMMKDLGSNV